MLARRQGSFWRDQQGSALIEGAAMIPLLIALVTGVFEFSWFFYQQHLVAIGLHECRKLRRRRWGRDLPRSRTLLHPVLTD